MSGRRAALRRSTAALVLMLFLLAAGACADDGCDDGSDAIQRERDDLERETDHVGARGTVEALRERLGLATGDLRSMTTLQKAIDELPGNPTFIRMIDADRDTLDDDGVVETTSGRQFACIHIRVDTVATGTAGITITDGRCR